jgi:hypothetical protein
MICGSWSYADFAIAGQDAFAIVGLLYSTCRGTRLKNRGLPGLHVAPTSRHFSCGCSCYQSKVFFASDCVNSIFFCLQEVTSSRARFPKPVELYKVLSVFGRNIVASEGEEWKRYRTITAPAFSEVSNGCRCCHFLNTTLREILGWYGTKRSGSCSTCSTMSGETVPKSSWITA